MKRRLLNCIFVVSFLFVGGCVSAARDKAGLTANMGDLDAAAIQIPTGEFEQLPPFLIGPLDILSYQVYGMENFKGEIQVDAGGMISVPLVGTVKAAGLTTDELSGRIRQGLRAKYIRNPEVAVNAVKIVSQTVTVDGSVLQPGVYPIAPGMRLTSAIASARGLTETANSKDVVIFRTLNGKRYAGLYNLAAIRNGTYEDPVVYMNDTVVVGESRSKQLFKQLGPTVSGLIYPVVLLLTK